MIDWPALDLLGWIACSLAVTTGVLTQRATGGAFGMMVAPLVALFAPAFMPAGVLLVSVVVTLLCTRLPLGTIKWRELTPMVIGRGAGAVVAAGLVMLAPDPGAVAVLVALSVLAGVALSLSGMRAAVTTPNLVAAGLLSGVTGTLTSVGAPPILMLYQHHAASEARPTLNAFFLLGVVLSLIVLAFGGRISAQDWSFSLAMMPATALGFALAPLLLRWLDGRSLRPVILSLASLASVLILLRWVPPMLV
jgi:uncharacterized membrane protein YfcA